MDKEQAKNSIKKLHSTASELESSAIINLFEIDVSDIAIQELLYKNKNLIPINADKIFRFHNNPKIIDSSIWYNDVEYIGAPIKIDGFESSSKGTLPSPKMSITAKEESIHSFHLLKQYFSIPNVGIHLHKKIPIGAILLRKNSILIFSIILE